MKRFRFRPQSLLDWKRARGEELEAALGRLRARKASSDSRAEQASAASARTRRAAVAGERLSAVSLQVGAAWAAHLDGESAVAREASRRLEEEARKLLIELTHARREAEALERLRERRRSEWRREADREAEALVAELFLARRGRGFGASPGDGPRNPRPVS